MNSQTYHIFIIFFVFIAPIVSHGKNSKKLIISPYSNTNLIFENLPGVPYTEKGIEKAAKSLFENDNFEVSISLQPIESRLFLDSKSKFSHSTSVKFLLSGIPIHGKELRFNNLNSGDLLILGSIPKLDKNATLDVNWPDLKYSWNILEELYSEKELENLSLHHSEKTYIVLNNKPVAVWKFSYSVEDLPYIALVNENKVHLKNENYYNLTGRVQAYVQNPADGELEIFNIELLGNNTLTSKFFNTKYADSSRFRAESLNHEFIFQPEDSHFSEASVFVNAHRILTEFRKLGFMWEESEPMNLILEADLANAYYSITEKSIVIGEATKNGLNNLALDREVMYHEFGHHVIAKYIPFNYTSEITIIHEGLADIFTYLFTKNSCLGESVCTSASSCISLNCLRQTEVTFKYQDEEYNGLPNHQKSQILSGMLWDLYQSILNEQKFGRLLLRTLDLIPSSPDIQEFFVALISADKELYSSTFKCLIYNHAISRGFDILLKDLSLGCSSINTADPNPETQMLVEDSSNLDSMIITKNAEANGVLNSSEMETKDEKKAEQDENNPLEEPEKQDGNENKQNESKDEKNKEKLVNCGAIGTEENYKHGSNFKILFLIFPLIIVLFLDLINQIKIRKKEL